MKERKEIIINASIQSVTLNIIIFNLHRVFFWAWVHIRSLVIITSSFVLQWTWAAVLSISLDRGHYGPTCPRWPHPHSSSPCPPRSGGSRRPSSRSSPARPPTSGPSTCWSPSSPTPVVWGTTARSSVRRIGLPSSQIFIRFMEQKLFLNLLHIVDLDQRMFGEISSVPGNMLAKVTLDQVNIFFRN